ncbi:two-component system, NarL family, nitrate/nitrite sensor histidine kinase NarX [Burkholderiales bacterium]|nr:two-component system, NarL family, nitrate/nitrite sensor histidine kinase NarX [Burkholderiales bacterium]
MNARPALFPSLAPADTLAVGAPPVSGQILFEIASSLSNAEDLDALLKRFLDVIVGLAGASAGTARVLSDDAAQLRLIGAVGLPAAVLEREFAIDRPCGACGDAVRLNSIQDLDDLQACAEHASTDYFGRQCQRILAVPLVHKGRVLGMYTLFFNERRALGEEQRTLFRSIGELLGLALENARLARENLRATVMHERQMMANEVHDSLAQTLSYMKMRMVLLEKAIQDRNEARLGKYVNDINEALSSAYSTLRELLTHFRRRLGSQGLIQALRETADKYFDKTGVSLDFDNQAPELHLSVDQEMQAFNIVQEALANIFKHSGARHARLAIRREGEVCEILIEDDGSGLQEAGYAGSGRSDAVAHFGFNIMRERAQHLGGEISIDSAPAGGTRVRLRFPVVASRVSA